MKLEEAIDILENYNKWRRGADIPQPNPTLIGVSISKTMTELKKHIPLAVNNIDWEKQHCGVIQGEYADVLELMPDLKDLLATFPEDPTDFIWDVKVHMLMPNQFPCIPNWHRDMVPRDENMKEDESKIDSSKPMYLWLSNAPLTKFRTAMGDEYEVVPKEWHRFSQHDWHCGQAATEFGWRGLIRACHKDLGISNKTVNNPFGNENTYRRHSQVYVDAKNFKW